MSPTNREWTCASASTAVAGDFLQVVFEQSKDNLERYVLIQSQFEFRQGSHITIETDGGIWNSELTVHRARLDRHRLEIDGMDAGAPVRIVVNYAASDKTFADLKRVLKIMLPGMVVQ